MRKDQKGFFHTLLGKLFLSFVLLTALPILFISVFSFNVSDQALKSSLRSSQASAIRQLEQSVDMFVSQLIHIIHSYDLNDRIEKTLTAEPESSYEYLKTIQTQEAEMRTVFTTHNLMDLSCVLVGNNGMVFTNRMTAPSSSFPGSKEDEWIKACDAQPDKVVWLQPGVLRVYDDSDFEIAAVKQLRSDTRVTGYGYLALGIDERYLFRLYQELVTDENLIYLVDCSGTVLSHPDVTMLGEKADASILAYLQNNLDEDAVEIQGETESSLCVIRKISSADWYIVNTVPIPTVFAASFALQRRLWIICSVLLLLSLLLAIHHNHLMFKPIHSLVTHALDTGLSAPSPSEHDMLRRISPFRFEYADVMQRLEEMIERFVAEEESKRKAELDALQMQINPHFLYNTLTSIKCLLWSNQTELIEPTLNALMALLDRTMRWKDDFITFADELDYLRQYIHIHEIRMQQTILLNCDVAPKLQDCMLPKLILQPIVENALFHGIVPQRPPVISISAAEKNARLRIEVLDNGRGIAPDRLEKILQEKDEPAHRAFCGIGISNIAQRLRLYYGKDYAFTIHSMQEQGTLVMIELPLHKASGGEEHVQIDAGR